MECEVMELTMVEKTEFEALEEVIERGMKSFCDVGGALLKIRDGRFYRDSHRTFDDYCRERWGMARRTAYQYLEAAKATENVRSCAQILPLNEAQARPLTRLEPEQQREAWKEAVDTAPNGKITAEHVEQVVRQKESGDAQPDEAGPKEKDSPNLYNIKTMWNACSRRDQAKFVKWVKEYFPGCIKK
jgi:hypothetical protein